MKRIFEDGSEFHTSAVGTGFFYERYGRQYLVSNYHCLAGKDYRNGRSIGTFIPNQVEFSAKFKMAADIDGTGTKFDGMHVTATVIYAMKLRMLHPDGTDALVFSEGGEYGDVAAIPVAIPKFKHAAGYDGERLLCSVNERALFASDRIQVGEDCFVVGFPRGLEVDGVEPIWKKASVASDPNSSYNGEQVFLVDTATREGMSGSPVVRRQIDYNSLDDLGFDMDRNTYSTIVGIYSGRIGTDELGVQLGKVWPISCLENLLDDVQEQPEQVEARFLSETSL